MPIENSNNSEFTEEEMNDSVGFLLGLVAGAVVTGIATSYATAKFLEWNDNRKAKKTAKN